MVDRTGTHIDDEQGINKHRAMYGYKGQGTTKTKRSTSTTRRITIEKSPYTTGEVNTDNGEEPESTLKVVLGEKDGGEGVRECDINTNTWLVSLAGVYRGAR